MSAPLLEAFPDPGVRTHGESIMLLYVFLLFTGMGVNLCYFTVLAQRSALFLGMLNSLSTVAVVAVSHVMFCDGSLEHSAQCATPLKGIVSMVVAACVATFPRD